MSTFKIQATKFTIVGAVNFVLTFAIFTSMLKVFHINYLLSLGVAWIIGMIFSYALNYLWVFKPENRFRINTRFIKYSIASTLSISFNLIALKYIYEISKYDPFYIQISLIPIIVILNFLAAKYRSLR